MYIFANSLHIFQDYLELNKKKKFIDTEDLFRTLYDQYPEYGRKKFKVFKVKSYVIIWYLLSLWGEYKIYPSI